MFSLQLPVISIILAIATLFPVIFLLTFYRSRITRVEKYMRNSRSDIPENMPPVSVIIYTNNDSDNLARMLNDALNQNYPAGYEVIVVNDGSTEATKDIINEYRQIYSNLYTTYTPDEARCLSRKKLSLTMGIKAAKTGYVVITSSSCRIKSPDWLASMARHFARGKEIVIGYASHPIDADTAFGCRTRAFNNAVDATAYLSAAISGKPFRGTGVNIAYSTKIFFGNKGFSHSLNLNYGDDDIFISEIATSENTAVELSPESYIERVFRRDPKKVYHEQKSIRNFTAKHLSHSPKYFWGFSSLMMWTWLLLSATTVITSLPNLLMTAIIFALALILWLPLIIAWRKTSIALHSRKAMLSIPFMLLHRPIHNFINHTFYRHSRRWNYTWQKL